MNNSQKSLLAMARKLAIGSAVASLSDFASSSKNSHVTRLVISGALAAAIVEKIHTFVKMLPPKQADDFLSTGPVRMDDDGKITSFYGKAIEVSPNVSQTVAVAYCEHGNVMAAVDLIDPETREAHQGSHGLPPGIESLLKELGIDPEQVQVLTV